jgi:hypothetical protein
MQCKFLRLVKYLCLVLLLFSAACGREKGEGQANQQLSSPSPDAILQTDRNPPVLHVGYWEIPQPLSAPVDQEGDELAPFITLAGDELYFFYASDLSVSEAKRALDGVSGIYYSKKTNGVWSDPERVMLSEENENALDSCVYTDGQTLWFCSKRVGNNWDGNLYLASRKDGTWQDWRNAGKQLNEDYDVGEPHLSADQNSMIFSANRAGGFGLIDLWQTQRVGEGWSEPLNLGDGINSTEIENYPYLSEDGTQLWFTSYSRLGYPGFAIFRSIIQDGMWGEPQEIISDNVSEVSIDRAGNLYFAHFFFNEEGELLGSKIYVAYKSDDGD